jgi:hypothetical protein
MSGVPAPRQGESCIAASGTVEACQGWAGQEVRIENALLALALLAALDLEVVLHHQTDRAVLVSLDGDCTKAKWLPKSAIELERMPDSTHYTLTLPEQLAIDKELV